MNESEYYGEIEEFFTKDNKYFAFLNRFEIISNLNNKVPAGSGHFLNYASLNNFRKFYKCIDDNKKTLVLIDCDCIISKCIIIKTKKASFITKIAYDFEHD